MATTVDQLIVEIRAETKKLRKGLNDVNKKLNTTKKTTKSANQAFAKMKQALVAIGAGAVLGKVVQINRTFEDLEATLRAVTGSAEAAAKSFDLIRAFTAQTTFQIEEVATAFITLKQAGIVPTSDALMDFGNFAAGMGKSITQLAQAAFNATTGEMEMLKQFGVVARQQGDKITVTFDGTTTQIERSGESIVEFLRKIGREEFTTAIEERFNTLSGAISNLKDQTSEFAISIGDGVGGIGLRQSFIDLSKATASLVETLRPLGQIFGLIIGTITNVITAIVELVDTIFIFARAITDLRNMGNLLREIISGNVKTFEDFKNAVRGGLGDLETLDAEIEKLVVTTQDFKDEFTADELTDFKLFTKLQKQIADARVTIDDLIKNDLERLKAIINKSVDAQLRLALQFGPILGGAEAERNQIIQDLLGTNTIEEFLQEVRDGMEEVTSMSAEMRQAIINSSQAFTNEFVEALVNGESALQSFADFAKNIVNQIITIFLQMAVVNEILNSVFNLQGSNRLSTLRNPNPTDTNAGGGTVQRNMPTLVGERGPEIFIPHSGGTIMNNMNSKNAMGGGTTVINQSINFSTGVVPTVRAEVMKLMPQIADVTKGAVAEAAVRGGNYRRALQGG
tara:strand:- start:3558 stop:5432 length:1875 start_codon:yes stop_codon:yes gene_type:complete